ncbi:velvet factor-domain-containing protein [Rhexocercosporidium sp. MPI-PUGE-AT-0058]|nr:velvet factor-domain-containing protein [Rhexocercosporidium sp. MPI-PUGE-AT-0058]
MSLTQPPGGLGGGPSGYAYPADGDRSRQPAPTLPSMSSLLNQEPTEQPTQQNNQYMARQFQPPYNMANQPHPLYQSQQDPNAPVQHIYHPPPAPTNSHSSQAPPEPMLMHLDGQRPLARFHSGAAPSASRQAKPIKKRRADHPKDHGQELRSEFSQRYNPAQASRSPSQASFEPEGVSSRRDSTFSESSSRGMTQMQTSKMPISGLLSEEPSPAVDRPVPRYTLRMRQQPVAARACGFGERDRRVIDPPPILQMDVSAPHLTALELSQLMRSQYSVIHCTLWDTDNNCDATAMPGTTDKRQQRRLMGTLVSSPFVGKDEHGVEGCFFTFPDLSVRTPGKYSLKFSLVRLDPTRMCPGNSEPVRSTIISSDFQVFNAKDFGGMRASTALTKTLKHQGCLISVKKGNSKNNRDDDDDDEDENNDDDEGDSSTKRGKRPKR